MGKEGEFMRKFKIVQVKGMEFPFFIYEKRYFKYHLATGKLGGAYTNFSGAVIQIRKYTTGNVKIKGNWTITTCTPIKENL